MFAFFLLLANELVARRFGICHSYALLSSCICFEVITRDCFFDTEFVVFLAETRSLPRCCCFGGLIDEDSVNLGLRTAGWLPGI